jgi:Domain of unknown function (DUF927)
MSTNYSAIRKVARIEDKATGKYLEVIEFPISDLQSRRLELLPSTVNDPKAMERELLDAGAVLEPDRNRRKQTLEAVAKTKPFEEWIYEDHTGWIENGTAFVTTNGVIGDVPTKIVGANSANSIHDRSGKLSTAGGWKAWRDGVAEPARSSTTLMFSISGRPRSSAPGPGGRFII